MKQSFGSVTDVAAVGIAAAGLAIVAYEIYEAIRRGDHVTNSYERMQKIMADNAVNSIIEASVNGTVTREAFEMAIRAALVVDDKLRANKTWRARVNLNSANDGEIAR